jgi:hypothetical protein
MTAKQGEKLVLDALEKVESKLNPSQQRELLESLQEFIEERLNEVTGENIDD